MRSLALVLLVAVGAWLGVWLGQSLVPVEYTDSNPETLSASARAHYVTNIAIAYAADADIPAAQERLSFLETTSQASLCSGWQSGRSLRAGRSPNSAPWRACRLTSA